MVYLIILILSFNLVACGNQDNQPDLGEDPKEICLGEEDLKQERLEEEDPIKLAIDSMDKREKVGQLIMTKADIDLDDLELYPFGGFLFFRDDFMGIEGTRTRVEALNKASPKAFIAVDEEGGLVERFPKDYKSFPRARDIGSVDSEEFFFDYGQLLARKLRSLNFNLNFAPVLDIDSNPNNPVIGSRAFSSDPEAVIKAGLNIAKGMESQGVLAVSKHFPGHGDTDLDSHFDLPSVDKDLEDLKELELLPFKAFIDSGGRAIIVGHILYTKLDGIVSSLSEEIISKLLRRDLGFEGLIFSDDMIMEAVLKDRTIEEASRLFLDAGGDVLVISDKARAKLVFDHIYEDLKSGSFSEEELDQKLYRILSLKEGLGQGEEVSPDRINEDLDRLLDREGFN